MKTIIVILIGIAIIAVGGYFGVNALLTKQENALRLEIKNLEQRVQKIEDESKVAPLSPNSDVNKIIKTVNALYLQLKELDNSLKKEVASINDSLKNQSENSVMSLKKQSEIIDKNYKEQIQQLKEIKFDAFMANIRSHILKARMELVAKNIGNAKAEIEFIDELLEKTQSSVQEENRKTIIDMQSTIKKIKSEIDSDLPSAINRINTLWHDMGRLIRRMN